MCIRDRLREAAVAAEQTGNDPQCDSSAQPVPEIEFDQGIPPRQNSCRPDMILNLGAIRMNDGTVRREIQEHGGGAVVAAGERECWRSGKRDRSLGADINQRIKEESKGQSKGPGSN